MILVFLIYLGISLSLSADPCVNFKTLPQIESRFTNNIADTDNGEKEICDKFHIPTKGDWYKSVEIMPTSAPDSFTCGTTFPIWMNGTLPSQADGIVSRKACKVTPANDCAESYNIQMKKCNNFWVYFLPPTTGCMQAYCFGVGVVDTPPTYKAPKPILKYKMEGVKSQDTLFFHCEFEMSTTEDLFYQVFWYADEEYLISSAPSKTNDPSLTALTEEFIQLGKTIECGVKAKYLANGKFGPISKSDGFYAGVKVPIQVINLHRGTTANVPIQLTLPFGCLWRNGQSRNCEITVEMTNPQNHEDRKCNAEIAAKTIGDADRCQSTISRNNWQHMHNMTISYMDTGKYVTKSSFVLNLQLRTEEHKIWDGFRVPDILINIIDGETRWKGKVCQAQNDPHMTTFDQRKYENHNPGKFILYENTNNDFLLQVQMQTYWCSSNIYCICGAAVRAGGDVYKIDLCNRNKEIRFVSCSDRLLDVRRKKGNIHEYVIILPTGTEVHINLSGQKQLNIKISASVHDFEKTAGLCGFLNDDCTDDLIHRDTNRKEPHNNCKNSKTFKDEYPNVFSRSWSVKNNEDLFALKSSDNIDRWNSKIRYCTCPNHADKSNVFHCHPGSALACEIDDYYEQIGESCDVALWDDGISVSRKRKRRQVVLSTVSSQVNMSMDDARVYCKNYMQKSEAFNLCSNVQTKVNDDAVEMCALDITLAGSLDWMEQTLNSAKSSCFMELRKNNTFSEDSDSDDSSVKIANQIMEVLCPGVPVCSNNGICVNATCVCNDTFMAPDCSVKITDPPDIIDILGNGYCDMSKSSCKKAFLIGETIYETSNLSCKLTSFKISDKGSVTTNITTTIKPAHLETLVEVHCKLPSERKRRSTSLNNTHPNFVEGYGISVSYDGANFGDSFNLYLFDSRCQEMRLHQVTNTPVFSLKAGYCYIDQNCIPNGQGHKSNKCFICDPDKSKFGWTFNEFAKECQTTKTKLDGSTGFQLWIIGAVLPSVLVPVIIVVACMVYKKSTRKRKTVGDSQVFDAMPSNGLRYAQK